MEFFAQIQNSKRMADRFDKKRKFSPFKSYDNLKEKFKIKIKL